MNDALQLGGFVFDLTLGMATTEVAGKTITIEEALAVMRQKYASRQGLLIVLVEGGKPSYNDPLGQRQGTLVVYKYTAGLFTFEHSVIRGINFASADALFEAVASHLAQLVVEQ